MTDRGADGRAAPHLAAAVLVAAGCTSGTAAPAPADAVAAPVAAPAEAEPSAADVERAVALDRDFYARRETPAPAGEPWFRVLPGSPGAAVLVVAGHATAHPRDGAWKPRDVGTGALAVVLHEAAGVPAIHTTWRAEADPNDGDGGAFKARLGELLAAERPAVVLDLHTSKSRRAYDVDLGTMHGASLLGRDDLRDALEAALRAEGVAGLSRDFFPAARQDTVTKFVAARGVPCIQVEINGRWTPGREADAAGRERALRLLRALVRFAREADFRPGPARLREP